MTTRDDVQHAISYLSGRETEIRRSLERLDDRQVRNLAVRLLIVLRQLGGTEEADELEDSLDFEELREAMRESEARPTYTWEDIEAELDALDTLGR